jgi:transcriptional repressor NrdR
MVSKRNGQRQPFDRSKVMRGLEIACRKRPISRDVLEKTVQQVEQWAATRGAGELASDEIGERIMHHLYALDPVAYVRFVSVYRSFNSIAEFEHLLHEMDKAEHVDIEGQRTLFELGYAATSSLPGVHPSSMGKGAGRSGEAKRDDPEEPDGADDP